MAIVLSNGEHYIAKSETGKISKTRNLKEAYDYIDILCAKQQFKDASAKTKDYFIFDTESGIRSTKKGRRIFSTIERKMIYKNTDGKCQLCGRKIDYKDMTVDYIIHLSQGGLDDLDNLECTCKADNEFKANILPETFFERITEIFMYQMEKKHGNSLKWKIAHNLLMRML